MNKKILYVLLGAVSILLGGLCLFNKELPFILGGIGLLIYGIGGFFSWRERRKAGAASVWAMAGMIVSIAFGIFILVGRQFGFFAVHILLISLSIWLIAEGVLEVLGAIMYRKAMTSVELGVQAPGSKASMVLGAVMLAVGILGLIFPVFAEFAIVTWIVAELIVSGVRLIWMARSAGALEEGNT